MGGICVDVVAGTGVVIGCCGCVGVVGMLSERIVRGRAHGRGVIAVDGFRGRRDDGFAVSERLPEFMAGMVGLQDVDVHILVGLADTAETKGSGWAGGRVGVGQSWV